MNSVDAYIYIAIGVFGVAYPIIFQVISGLENKYTSPKILALFEKEWERKLFQWLLYLALFWILLWTWTLPVFIPINNIPLLYLAKNSAAILIALSTTFLVVLFFLFLRKILIYYSNTKLADYLISKYNKRVTKDNKNTGVDPFEGICDLLLHSIRNDWEDASIKIGAFFSSEFHRIKENSGDIIEYPDAHRYAVYQCVEELARLKTRRNYFLEYRAAGNKWLLGESHEKSISAKTFRAMWDNLTLSVIYERDEFVLLHWETAHQYLIFNLPVIFEQIDYSSRVFKVTNEVEVKKRNKNRNNFLEFHYFLGGLLLYKKRYKCIATLFSYTTSQPPRYELLPGAMGEIFWIYNLIVDPYERNFPWIAQQYPFPDQSGMSAHSLVKKWACSYAALLFLRQYIIYPYLTIMRPLDYPHPPNNQGEIRRWIDNLDFFKQLVNEHIENKALLHDLGFSFITTEYCEGKGIPYPLDFIDTFKAQLQAAYHHTAIAMEIADEKVSEFKSATKTQIEKAVENLQRVNNSHNFDNTEADFWYLTDKKMTQGKDAFSNQPEAHHLDFDSILAVTLKYEMLNIFEWTFINKKTKSYLLREEDILLAIDKLKLTANYVIITMNYSLAIPNHGVYHYDTFNSSEPCIYIVSKNDLPIVSTKSVGPDIVAKYHLENISSMFNIFVSVIDLNRTSPEVFNENLAGTTPEELKKSALLSIFVNLEIKWKRKTSEIIQVRLYNPYRHKALPNTLDQVESLNKKRE